MSKFLTHTYQNICTGDLVLVRNNEDIQYNSIQTATQSQSHMLVHVYIVYTVHTKYKHKHSKLPLFAGQHKKGNICICLLNTLSLKTPIVIKMRMYSLFV